MLGEVRNTPRLVAIEDVAQLRLAEDRTVDTADSDAQARRLEPGDPVDDPAVTRGAVEQHGRPARTSSSTTNSANSSLSRRRANRRSRPAQLRPVGDRRRLRPSEGLAERHGDRERSVAFLTVERHAEIDADRAEAGIITDADAGGEAPVLDVGKRSVVSEPPSKKGQCRNCRRTASAGSALRARTRRGRGRRSGRHPESLGSELLITVAAHRSAAARIESPRRRDVERGRRRGCAEPDRGRRPRSLSDTGLVGARVDLGARIGEGAAVERDFRARRPPRRKPRSGRADCRCRHRRGSAAARR